MYYPVWFYLYYNYSLFYSVSSEKNYSRRPLYSQATSSTDTGPSYSHNTQYELSTSSSATHSAARSTYSCQADGCNNPVHFDPQLGYFSYCSARCRDVHILPGYNEKLKADISAFEDNLLTANKVKKTDLIREVVIKTKPRELVGLTFAQLGNTKVCRFNPLATELFCQKLTDSKLSVSCARFYSMQYANCFTLFYWWVNVSGHVITTELATPILELKPLNCCDLGFFGQTLTFIQACWPIQKPGDDHVSIQHCLDLI